MALPLPKSYPPMEAQLIDELPAGDTWQYEPKWDGFRCLIFRDGKSVSLQSKSGQPLDRYFPEMVEAFGSLKANRFILDAELVIPLDGALSFDALLQRIHPAATRIKKLSIETPAVAVVFDLLADVRGKNLSTLPLAKRRPLLEAFAGRFFPDKDRLLLSPCTQDAATAKKWFEGAGGDLDGVIAKRLDLPYESGTRHGMVKYKKRRTADCVVGGFRYAAKSREIGSLLLGVYNDEGLLDHVGFCSAFTAAERKKLTAKLTPLIKPPGFTGNTPGRPSRWSTERSTEWQPLATKLVVEVQYDHFTGGRFRHGTKILRWRLDKAPRQCTTAQLRQESSSPLKLLTHHSHRAAG